ncbi:MAG: phosphatase PAP2 family protein [Rikenellaceae bacterium]
MNTTWDHSLFLLLNFDGGAFLDSVMLFISGKTSWIPLYALILFLIYRINRWSGVAFAIVAIGVAVGLSDIIAGIFKHSGLLDNLLPNFPVRLRPMHEPLLEGLVHSVKRGGMNGTVSAHAATAFSIGFIATSTIKSRWFCIVMWSQVALVCYSRIYLGYHYPQDILLGIGIGQLAGGVMWWLLRSKIVGRSSSSERYSNPYERFR